MKIEIVTLSCDSHPIYYEFWHPVSKYWKTKFKIHPVLLYYGNDDIHLSEEYGDVFKFKENPNIPGYMAGCWGRFWLTKKYPDKVCMTGDIDLIPLQKKYFSEDLEKYKTTDYIHLNADGYCPNNFDHWKVPYNTVPACYHVALGKVFHDVYSFETDFYKEMKRYKNTDYTDRTEYAFHSEKRLKHASKENGGNWGHDEVWSSDLLRNYLSKGGSVKTEVGIQRRRICRSNWQYEPSDVKNGKYIDSHLLRPYSEYKNKIDSLMDLIA